jgi:hypothetical protein
LKATPVFEGYVPTVTDELRLLHHPEHHPCPTAMHACLLQGWALMHCDPGLLMTQWCRFDSQVLTLCCLLACS